MTFKERERLRNILFNHETYYPDELFDLSQKLYEHTEDVEGENAEMDAEIENLTMSLYNNGCL